MKRFEVSIDEGATGVEVVLIVDGASGQATMTADQARELARHLQEAATAADKVNSERVLRRHRPALRFEV